MAKPEPATTPHTVVLPDRATKGTGTSISADLKDFPALLEKIRTAAKADDREVSNWLRRRLVELDRAGLLIPPDKPEAK